METVDRILSFNIKGIGPATAKKIVEYWHEDFNASYETEFKTNCFNIPRLGSEMVNQLWLKIMHYQLTKIPEGEGPVINTEIEQEEQEETPILNSENTRESQRSQEVSENASPNMPYKETLNVVLINGYKPNKKAKNWKKFGVNVVGAISNDVDYAIYPDNEFSKSVKMRMEAMHDVEAISLSEFKEILRSR